MSKYAKSITAFVTGILGWLSYVIAANPTHFTVTNPEWLALAVAVATALGVYGMPNTAPVPSIPSDTVDPTAVATVTNQAMQGIAKDKIQGAQ